MSILDERFEEFQAGSIEERIKCFKQDGRLFDMIVSQQLDRKILNDIYDITNQLRTISKSKSGSIFIQNLLCHKRAMLYFTQPSSRTFLSFESACHMLGMRTSEIRDSRVSSEIKGESFDDSLRTYSSYTDLIIMRNNMENSAERAAWLLNTWSNRCIPVVNGGSGSDQHPTQAILDIYTLQKSFASQGGLDGKTVLMCGDLRRGRTVRSLSYLIKNFEDIRLIYTAPQSFQMKGDVCEFLEKNNIPFIVETESIDNVISEADAIYMTRIQDEYDLVKGESGKVDISRFTIGLPEMKKVKPNGIIMHPFPRRNEIDVAVDSDPRAMYWRQERNGMWTRAALIAYIFNVHNEILNF